MNNLLCRLRVFSILFGSLLLISGSAHGEFLWFKKTQKARITPPGKLIGGQAPLVINQDVYDRLNDSNMSIIVSLSRQRAYVTADGQLAIDSPISSGKAARRTPSGSFTVLQKDRDHRSSIYGDFVDSRGRVVRSGVSALIDAAPSGTHYVGAPMFYFMRLTWGGVGMHVGYLPGYAASHGCIRMPLEAAKALYMKVRVGTPVKVVD